MLYIGWLRPRPAPGKGEKWGVDLREKVHYGDGKFYLRPVTPWVFSKTRRYALVKLKRVWRSIQLWKVIREAMVENMYGAGI